MALHIFTVNQKTFKVHLNYMFAGTGKDGSDHQSGALADISGIRIGDKVCFYVTNVGFFGFFKVVSLPFYENYEAQYLDDELKKTLTYRVLIEPDIVYQNGKSEWDVLQNPDYIKNHLVFNMQWAWIFKKLNANRGCLSIDKLEEELLIEIISSDNIQLPYSICYDFENKIIRNGSVKVYVGNTQKKIRDNYKINKEEDLRILFTSKANENELLDKVLRKDIHGNVNFISNEFLCSFSERKLDLAFGTDKNHCLLIELKNNFLYDDGIYNQLKEYSRYISKYKLFYDKIFPILIIKEARIISERKNSKYFKFLSKENLTNNILSPWYSEVLEDIKMGKEKLKLENILNLQDLQVFTFTVDDDNNLLGFNRIL